MNQVIVYEAASGRVLRVVDPHCEIPDAKLIAIANLRAGELASIYPKKGLGPDGKGLDHAHSWQAHVNGITGLEVVFGAVSP